MAKKLKIKCKGRYKGVIDKQLLDLYPGDEFHCSPDMALKLSNHYDHLFDILELEEIEETKEEEKPKKTTKKKKSKKKPKKLEVEDKSISFFESKEDTRNEE